MDAPLVWEYLCTYPLTAYVHNVVKLLNITTHKIQTQNINDSRQAEIENVEIYTLVAEIDETYSLLDKRDKQFVNREELKIPAIFNSALEKLVNNINAWNKRKTKYSSDDEAKKNARKFMEDLDNWFVKFENEIMQAFLDAIEEITLSNNEIYGLEDLDAETDDPYDTFGKNMVDEGVKYYDAVVSEFEETENDLPDLINDFLFIRQETLVEASDGLFGLFGRNKNEPKELVPEITYLLSEWREIAEQTVQVKADELLDTYKNKLFEYYNNSSYKYHAYLQMELTKLSAQRKETLFKLSDDARLLQTDIDWTSEFIRQVEVIGKG
ncbi:hypothetical protein [Periweissella fabalis]|uniref:Uncharacterized protein n=1 Tax=Periweissella fabalis TaxID=1070421 RepID=A0A7X6S1W5_9LACO|nr:hypothetical protein [Periweissella fabalis]MCM0599155.1 hypothetical protein [Periweissella fabalis]NKZ23434.1 hypothetical protein [Periweissella fabalis]